MNKNLVFRVWFYFRQGWNTYFTFIIGGINVMVTTYFLAIENAPLLKQVFPTFTSYLAILSIIGIPLVIGIGFAHFKKMPAYKSEAEITVEANPYIYKLA